MEEKTHNPDAAGDAGIDQPSSRTSSDTVSKNLDDAYALYKSHDAQNIDPVEAKRVLRKIDLRILPILFVTYLLQ